MQAKELLVAEMSGWKAGRIVTDFCLQAIQRAVVLATVSAAAKITGDPLIGLVEAATLLLFFGWVVYSGAMSARWMKIQTIDRPGLYRWVAPFAFIVEFGFISVLFLASTSFANAMTERLAAG